MAEQFREPSNGIYHSDTFSGDILSPASLTDLEHDHAKKPTPSEEFVTTKAIIEDGIKKSTESGYAELKVDFWVADDSHQDGGYTRHIGLGQFLAAALPKMVTKSEEYHELLDMYIHRSEEYAEAMGHKFGAPALQSYESGRKSYADGKSAAAGDER